ncbi:MAG: hypothetical protein RRA35_06315, partial [Desulfomonilia bacterium]|nr:hypothetical protein [Desulfomonilia bacterium]
RTFTITPDTCRFISDVLVDGSSVGRQTSYTFENVTADHTISASFGLLSYAITPSAGTGGSISPSNTVMVSCGGSRTFTISPDEHYHIADVLVDGSSVGAQPSYTFSDVDSPHTIQALFAIDTHTLTVIHTGTGLGTTTPSAGFHEYDYGTVVDLSASASASSTFDGWSGDIDVSGTSVTMDTDKSITATFTLRTFTITASSGENGTIDPSGSTTVTYGSDQVFTFTPDTGYEVDTVTIDGQATTVTGNTYTFTNVTADHTIGVTFKVLVEETTWSKTYGGTDVEEAPEKIIATDDGGYAFITTTRSFGDTSGDIWFVKLDASGAIEMEKGLGGDSIEYGTALIQTSDQGYLVAGRSYSYRTGSSYDDIWLVKLSSSGTVEWQRTYGDTGYDAPVAVHETFDEFGDTTGYILTGYTTSFGAGGYDVWVLKLGTSGAIEWQKTYGGSGDDFGRSIQATADGGYVFTADTQSFGAGGRDVWVVKTSSTGVVEWEKTYGGSGWDIPESIQVCTDGGYIVGAYTDSFGAGNEDGWVIKLNSDGTLAWQYTYGGEDADYLADLITTDDGGYVMTGWSYSYTQPYWGGNNDAWVVKLDATGQIVWQRCYNKPYEDSGEIINAPDWANSVVQAEDGGYAIVGLTDDWDYDRNDDIWVFKVDSLGVLGCDIGMATTTVPDGSAVVSVSSEANPYAVSDTDDSAETPAGSVFDTTADVFTQCEIPETP